MPLDDRLRGSLRGAADDVRPDVEHHLAVVRQRSQRAVMPQGSLLASVVVIAVVAVALVVTLRATGLDPAATVDPAAPSHAAAFTASPETSEQADVLAGRYLMRLEARGSDASASSMAGDWELDLGTDLRILLTPPAGFETPSGSSLDGYVYVLRGQQLFTNLFARHFEHSCVGSGSYRWELVDARLTITAIDDLCLPRVALLTTEGWTRTGE